MQNDTSPLPELNLRVIVLGLALSVIMGSANVYLGLKAGMTVSASIPAAVVGMLALKYFSRMSGKPSSILEANQIQSTMCIPPTAGASFLMAYWSFNDGNDATISDLTGNGNNGTLVIGGEGYWDADVYEDACLGSCVDTVITSFPFYHLSTLENNKNIQNPEFIGSDLKRILLDLR